MTKEEYGQHGSKALGEALVRQLQAQGKRPYLIPVGGSNALGTWGYLQVGGARLNPRVVRHGRAAVVLARCGSRRVSARFC